MGLKQTTKGKKAEGLAELLRREPGGDRPVPTEKPEELSSALRYIFNFDPTEVSLTQGGAILYRAVEEALRRHLEDYQRHREADPAAPEGRVGAGPISVDRKSSFGQLEVMEENRLSVESKRSFSSCRTTHCFFAGRWMYEAVLGTGGIQQIGWATLSCPFNRERGVGDGDDSYAYDGKRLKKWNVDAASYGQAWAAGDVIGCCADFDQGEMTFYRNGKSMGTAFRNVRTMKEDLGYFPAISLSEGERCTFNFGTKPFYFPVEGYKACEPQPEQSECRLVQYLMGCLERLTEMTTFHGVLPPSEALFPRSKLTTDECVLIGALIVREMRPFIRNTFHVINSVLPSFRKVLGKAEPAMTEALMTLIHTLSNTLGSIEAASMLRTIMEHVAESCIVFPFKASEVPYTASYPHLKLMVAMLKSPVVRRVLFDSERWKFVILEQCLVLKQPTTDDLKELLPSVWWKGCKDETMSEESMNSFESTLSGAYLKVEQMQHELLQTLIDEDVAHNNNFLLRPKNLLINFLSYLLEKNAGAVRNVPPPGLSNMTVIVSVFNFLLSVVRPHFTQTEVKAILHRFPVKDLFVHGAVGGGAASHEELPRLGGVLSHLMKEYPVVEEETIAVQLDQDSFPTEVLRSIAHPDDPTSRFYQVLIPKLLHIFLLLYRLGVDTSIKMSMNQFQAESAQRSALLKSEAKLTDPETSEEEKKKIATEIPKQKEELLKAIRESVWCRIVWFKPPKQKSLFQLIVYLSKLIIAISDSSTNLLNYVPEVYVEAIVECFEALAKMEPRFGATMQLEMCGLQHIFSFLIRHFNHPRIINPQVCDAILQALSTGFSDKEFLKACQKNFDARQNLIPELLKAFDTRHWMSILNIFLSISKGTGFGHSSAGGSLVFRDLFVHVCNRDLSLLDSFLNRLFNTLNWTLTELVVALGEVYDALGQSRFITGTVSLRQGRKASVLFNLSANLLKLLEFVAGHIPAVFLIGPLLNITRVVEAVGYVLSHMTIGPDSAAFDAVIAAPWYGLDLKSKISKTAILAPVAGILCCLHESERIVELEEGGGERHSIVRFLVEELACPADRLHHLANVDWKSTYSNIHKTQWMERLTAVLSAYDKTKQPERSGTGSRGGEDEEIPEEFLDPIMMTLMRDPVILPDSKITVDRATIERHLLTSSTDPFSRAELSADMLLPDSALQDKVATWIDQQSREKH